MAYPTAVRNEHVMNRRQLEIAAPSIFADQPWHAMSDRYRFIPTYHVLDVLRSLDFLPVRARQGSSRIEGKANFTKHVINLRHADFLRGNAVGAEFPEIILSNSHDGVGAYSLEGGIFRQVCTNGLVVNSNSVGRIAIRHASSEHDFDRRIIDVTAQVASMLPRVMEQVSDWRGMALPDPLRRSLAESALRLRDMEGFSPVAVLKTRRAEDTNTDLWTTVNVVQENMVRGGNRILNDRGARVLMRPIKSVDGDMRFNRALWKNAETLASMIS